MTIPKITPYSGGVANPDGSQTQTEFTQNMFDQLSYEAELSTELNNTVDGINDTATQVDADATSAAQSAVAADAAASGLNYQGLWPDTGGSANKGDTYQTQVSGTPTGKYFTALQNTIVDPIGDDINWRVVVGKSDLLLNFNTLNDVISNTALKVGYSVNLKERTSGGGGGSVWDVVLASAVVTNGFDIVACTGVPALALVLREDKKFTDPRKWGAVGDGVFDNAAVFQRIYDAGKTIAFVASEIFYTSATVNLPQFANMISPFNCDQLQPRIKTDNPNIDLVYAEAADTNEIRGIAFEYSDAVGTGRALALKNPNRCKVYDCTIFDAPEGFDFFGEPTTSPANNMWVGNFVSKCTGTAMRLYRTHNDFVSRNRLETSDICLHMEQTCFDNIVEGNEFSKGATVGLLTDGNSSGHIISNNVFALNERDADMGGRSIKFLGNTLKESNNHSVYLNFFRHGVIQGNTFRGVAKDATLANRYSAIWGNNAIEDCVISGNTFNSEFPLTARFCVVVRYSKDNTITGNTMVNGYIDEPVLDEFPTGYNEHEDNVIESTPVVFDSTIPDTCEPWQPVVGATFTINNPPPISRIMSISFRNNTGGVLSGTETKVKNFAGSEEVTITDADLENMAAGEVRTFRCGAGSKNNSQMATTVAVAPPVGIELAFGVWDGYQVQSRPKDVNDISSATSSGVNLTISNFNPQFGDFDVSPSPTVGDIVQVAYLKRKNVV